ncbi:uncharacterized protein V2V93DRAFT_363410 [Kockiozyma suomiensis]|uniref:uncharacterized protein n=1 Tax=Kockiozyma suomiensis TaxID=1337062 RepID=UPI003342F583
MSVDIFPFCVDTAHLLPFFSSFTMNRGPIILTIEEAEYLLDQLPPPGDNPLANKLRENLLAFLKEVRKGAEGTSK